MERLTERNPSWIDDELWERACEPDCEEIDAVYRKLKDYEDAEERGLLLRLLCKIEDMVYCIEDKQVWCCTIEKISISKNNGTWIEISFPEEMPNLASMEFYSNEIGKTVFLTREEAKAKLKEMEEKDGRQIFIPWKAD